MGELTGCGRRPGIETRKPFLPPIHLFFGNGGTIVLERDIMIASSSDYSMRTFHDPGGEVFVQAPLLEFVGVLSATGMVQ